MLTGSDDQRLLHHADHVSIRKSASDTPWQPWSCFRSDIIDILRKLARTLEVDVDRLLDRDGAFWGTNGSGDALQQRNGQYEVGVLYHQTLTMSLTDDSFHILGTDILRLGEL